MHAFSRYSGAWYNLAYWHLSSGIKVDFIVGDLELAVEAKSSSKIHADHLKGLRELKKEYPELKRHASFVSKKNHELQRMEFLYSRIRILLRNCGGKN